MTWVKLDDQFTHHPKVIAQPVEVRWSLVEAIVYCGRYNTDGLIPAGVIPPKHVEALVKAGSLEPSGSQWIVHDFLIYNKSRAQVEQDKQRKANAGRASGRARAEQGVEQSVEQESNSTDVRPVPVPVPVPNPVTRTQDQTFAPAARKRDELFEVVAEVTGIDWANGMPKSQRDYLNAAVAQLRPLNPSPDEVRRRAANWSWDTKLTPSSLAKRWGELDTPAIRLKPSTSSGLARAARLEADGR